MTGSGSLDRIAQDSSSNSKFLEIPGWKIRSGALLVLGAILVVVARHHEPWGDEAQAWLLARDSSTADLIWHNVRYEGAPPLWHLILHIAARAGLPYRSMQFIAIAIAWLGAMLFAMNPRVPTGFAVLVPFTYFFAYQYSVVARNYCLLLPLFGCLALCYRGREKHAGRTYAVLNALAWVSAHAAALAAVLLALHFWEGRRHWRKHALSVVLTAVNFAAIACIVWPPADLQSPGTATHFDPVKVFIGGLGIIVLAFHASGAVSALVLLLSLFWFYRTSVLRLFLAGCIPLALLSGVKYYERWHFGFAFMLWLYCVWIGFDRPRRKLPRALSIAGAAGVAAIFASQIYYSARSWSYDYSQPYSGSGAAAKFIAQRLQPGARVFAEEYPLVALQPYFKSNLFANYNDGHGPAYWKWSTGNDSTAEFDRGIKTAQDGDLIVITIAKKGLATTVADGEAEAAEFARYGFQQAAFFPGHLIWFGQPLQEESYIILEKMAR